MAGKVKRDTGGDRLLVKSGGTIEVATGGVLSVNGTDVSAGLEEIANLNGLSSSDVAALETLMLECGSATLAAPAAEAANARSVAVQLNNRLGAALAVRSVVGMYLSSDANGDTPIDAIANDVLPTAGTDGAFLGFATDSALADGLMFHMVSEADGDIDVVLTNAADAAITVYLNVVLPNGKLSTSAAIAFVDDTP